MPVYPIEKLPTTYRGRYEHLSKHDGVIWERFLETFAEAFDAFSYNVAFGGYLPDPGAGDDATRKGWQYETALKADALAWKHDAVWVIEVKPSARSSAIGAALCYVELAEVDRFTDLPLIPVVVTDQTTADIKYCAEQLGVVIVEVPEP